MAKLIRILVASFGGGMVLGAGIRLGEALAIREAKGDRTHGGSPDDLEARLDRRIEEQTAAVSALRQKLNAEARQIESLGELSARVHKELPDWIEKSVARRIGEAQAELKAESDRSRGVALDSFVDRVQTHVGHRISRLEEEVSTHSAAMTELRACSLRTEASIEKLAGGLDRLLAAQLVVPPVPSASRVGSAAASEPRKTEEPAPPAASPAEIPPVRPRRWSLFG